MTNSRIRNVAPGIVAERVAESTHIAYNPITQRATVTFVGSEYLLGEGDAAVEKFGTPQEVMFVQLDDIATRKFGANEVDPVSGAPLDDFTGAGVALYLKRVYHLLHNERAAEQTPAPPAPPSGGE